MRDSRGFALIPLLLLVTLGIGIGAYIINNPTNFFPKAKDMEERTPFRDLIGWAYSPLPDTTPEQMIEDMTEMRNAGANVVYISHNNKGDIDSDVNEPGLSYAVYASRNSSKRAREMLQAVENSLDAAREADLKVVLAIGYQISMGEKWSKDNLNELRKTPSGENMKHFGSVLTASPYSTLYRQYISSYYEWVNSNIITKYPNIIAVNLADEPMGGDYSLRAEEASGLSFQSSPPYQIGKFQSGVLADYADWSASQWLEINPNLWVMMTFHIERQTPFFPNFEQIFSQTPNNFVFSADTHYSDDPYRNLSPNDNLNALYGMTRTVGYFSRKYNKPLMLWVSANSWGLPNPNDSLQGEKNADIIINTVSEAGGNLGMIMLWGWNINDQEIDKSVSTEIFNYTKVRFSDYSPKDTPINIYSVCESELFTDIGTYKIYHLTRDDHNSILADKYKITDKDLDFTDQSLVYMISNEDDCGGIKRAVELNEERQLDQDYDTDDCLNQTGSRCGDELDGPSLIAPSCEYSQWSDAEPYSCQDGWACYYDWYSDTSTSCQPASREPNYHCEENPLCSNTAGDDAEKPTDQDT